MPSSLSGAPSVESKSVFTLLVDVLSKLVAGWSLDFPHCMYCSCAAFFSNKLLTFDSPTSEEGGSVSFVCCEDFAGCSCAAKITNNYQTSHLWWPPLFLDCLHSFYNLHNGIDQNKGYKLGNIHNNFLNSQTLSTCTLCCVLRPKLLACSAQMVSYISFNFRFKGIRVSL